VTDLDPIPFADADPASEPSAQPPAGQTLSAAVDQAPVHGTRGKAFWLCVVAAIAFLHGWAIWWGLGGWEGLSNGWPLWRDDHPLYFHSALVTRSFLKASWTTAGYDPSFMAGYAKSVVFPASSTLPEVAVAAFGGQRPEYAYKLYVLISAAAVPLLVALAAFWWRQSPFAIAVSVLFYLLYVWIDYPINYVEMGMVPYFLGIPVALVAAAAVEQYLSRGGLLRWLTASCLSSLAFLVHLTTAMVLVPTVLASYVAWILASGDNGGTRDRERSLRHAGPTDVASRPRVRRHIGLWLIPLVVLAGNAFWWWPGIWLASTKGPSGFAFAHPEGVVARFLQIIFVASPIQAILLALGLPGLFLLTRRSRSDGWALLGFAAAGLFWGYLAGAFRSLDFLQPGRHTYALFSALAMAAGTASDELRRRLAAAGGVVDRLDRWVLAGAALVAIRVLGFPLIDLPPELNRVVARLAAELNLRVPSPGLVSSLRGRLFFGEPFLSSKPSARLHWVFDRIQRHLKRGERLLYEEGGFAVPGTPDPYGGGRFSGLLPERTGVELLGGPYLHASLMTNFTQFGEGKLFGRKNWDREFFVRYAKLYRPAAILCWTPHARRFCKENPDLVRILDDDGSLLFGRVIGFEGWFISGSGEVEAEPGRIRLRNLTPDLDGAVVLRYHSVPGLVTQPSVASEPDHREDDPVPFLRLRPTAGAKEVVIDLHIPGWP
jgi:hypothetical protein